MNIWYRSINVTLQIAGIHSYPQAGKDPKLADVAFLAFPHRHLFKIDVDVQVFHNDRDLEFIQFKRWLSDQFVQGRLSASNQSCEEMAENIIRVISHDYPGRKISVSVSEDGESGATLLADPYSDE